MTSGIHETFGSICRPLMTKIGLDDTFPSPANFCLGINAPTRGAPILSLVKP